MDLEELPYIEHETLLWIWLFGNFEPQKDEDS